MNLEDFKQLLKTLYQPISLIAFAIGFILVLIIAFLLVMLVQRSKVPVAQLGENSTSLEVLSELPTADQAEDIQGLLPVVYQVGRGDSSWRIAQAFYGDGSLYELIEKENDLYHDQGLEIGMELIIPKMDQDSQKINDEQTVQQSLENLSSDAINDVNPDLETYVVQAGDSLWFIALKYLGSGNNWTKIYSLNMDVVGSNPDLIYPDQQLRLPRE